MKLYIVENGKLVPYTRRGECNHCGACCCSNTITVKGIAITGNWDGGESKIEQYEGWSTFRDRGMDHWWRFEVTSEKREPCTSLGPDGLCMEYENRPDCCRYFPVHPRDIEQFECGFWFEKGHDE